MSEIVNLTNNGCLLSTATKRPTEQPVILANITVFMVPSFLKI